MNSIGVRVFVVLLVSLASFVVGLVSEKNTFVERLMKRFNHDVAPRVTSGENEDTSSRALLASILGQTGLSPLDIPELSFASGNGQALRAVMLNEKRREVRVSSPSTGISKKFSFIKVSSSKKVMSSRSWAVVENLQARIFTTRSGSTIRRLIPTRFCQRS